MTHEQRTAFADWQELQLEEFEGLVDTHSFEAMIEANKVEDKMTVVFDSLSMEAADLPGEIAESHYFPGRFTLKNFQGELVRFQSQEKTNEWMAHFNYAIVNHNGSSQAYSMFADADSTLLTTENSDGAKLSYHFPPTTTGHMLASIAAVQMDLPVHRIPDYLKDSSVALADKIQALFKLVGVYDQSARLVRERMAWLPLQEEERALIIKLDELESIDHSGRKLGYKLAWNINGSFNTAISSLQVDFATAPGQEPYYSQRTGLDFAPDQLLEMEQLGLTASIGAFFNSDTSRREHATVASPILHVVRRYLEPFAILDLDLVDPGDDPEPMSV